MFTRIRVFAPFSTFTEQYIIHRSKMQTLKYFKATLYIIHSTFTFPRDENKFGLNC